MFSKVMKYLLNFHYRCLWQYSGTSLYILLRKKNSSFFFFFSKVEKHEFTYYFMAELNFNLYLYVLGKKMGDMTSICLT